MELTPEQTALHIKKEALQFRKSRLEKQLDEVDHQMLMLSIREDELMSPEERLEAYPVSTDINQE
jgi:hypothetical protein